jgi:hypothetical protein
VEYFSALSEDAAWEESKVVYKKIFNEEVERQDIQFIKTDSL